MPPKPPQDSEERFDPLTEEALAWLVKLHSGSETAQDWADYENWKARDADHQRAASRAEGVWQKLGPALLRKRGKGGTIPVMLAAVIGVGAVAFGLGVFGPPRAYFADQRTAIGEQRSLTLADGSQLDLDTATGVDIDLAGSERVLTLYDGQIFVTVKPDPARPFVVKTDSGTVRALGTAFAVRRDNAAVTVVVTESAVRVTFPEGAQSASVDVKGGEETVYTQGQGLAPPRAADVRRLTAWRGGKWSFERRPLGEVIAEMSRYRWGKVVITDPALSRLAVTGVFDTNDPDGLLDALAQVLPLKITRLPLLTLISSDPARQY